MKIHEYQAKGILKKYGVAVPRGHSHRDKIRACGVSYDRRMAGRCDRRGAIGRRRPSRTAATPRSLK